MTKLRMLLVSLCWMSIGIGLLVLCTYTFLQDQYCLGVIFFEVFTMWVIITGLYCYYD